MLQALSIGSHPFPPPVPQALLFRDTSGHSALSKWLPCQVSAASGLNAVGFKAMKLGSFHDKTCTFNHVPRNSNDCVQTHQAVPQRRHQSLPPCTGILGLVPTSPPSPRPVLCRRAKAPLPKVRDQERTELPLQSHAHTNGI